MLEQLASKRGGLNQLLVQFEGIASSLFASQAKTPYPKVRIHQGGAYFKAMLPFKWIIFDL